MKSDQPNSISGGARSANDARVTAARKRLAESRDQEDAIEGVREIVANFLGSEELGLFTVDRRTGTFRLFWSFGVDLENYDLVLTLGHAGMQAVMRGECHVERTPGARGELARAQAFVPIRSANQTVAILAILRLLPQKAAFDGADMELFRLLSEEAAKPLFGSRVESRPVSEGSGIEA